MMTSSTKKTAIRPLPPDGGKETSDLLMDEIRTIRDILAELTSWVRKPARPPIAGGLLPETAPNAAERLKQEIKSELWQEINHLKLKIARLEQKCLAMQKDMDIGQRLARLEERFEFLIEDQINAQFVLASMDREEEFEELEEDLDDTEEM